MKTYIYNGKNQNYHVLVGDEFTYFVSITPENFERGVVGVEYGLSLECKRKSIKQENLK